MMTKAPFTKSDEVIKELNEFSCLDMFGHLYDIPIQHKSLLRKAERHCALMLEAQLTIDLQDNNTFHGQAWSTITRSKLEQILSQIFFANSPFWERYYTRLNSTKSTSDFKQPPEASSILWHHMARTRYPSFFIVHDALLYGSGRQAIHHEIIQQSLQSLLKGYLLKACDMPLQCAEAFTNAIKLLGPVNAWAYREYLERLLPQESQ